MEVASHPFVLFAALSAVAALLVFVAAFQSVRGWRRAACILLASFLLIPLVYVFQALHQEMLDPRFRTYKSFYADIHVGMTRSEVLSLLERHYPSTGPRKTPDVIQNQPERLSFLMNPEDSGGPNAEGISVVLQRDRVVAKHYAPD